MKRICIFASLTAVLWSASSAFAQTTLADWTFETSQPTTAGPFSPEGGTEASTAQASGNHAGASVYSTPIGNGSAHSFSSTLWAVGDNYQFKVSTLGVQGIAVSYDQAGSGTGPAQFYLAYSTDGVNFTQFGNTYTLGTTSFSSTKASTAVSQSFDLSSISALNNVSVIYLRVVDASTTSISGATVGTGGTDRIDNFAVTASGSIATTGAPTIFTDVPSTNAVAGRTISLSVVASGSDPLSYQWYYPNLSTPLSDNAVFSGSTSATLTLNNITTSQAGSYQVIVSNSSGSVTSAVAQVVVTTPIATTIAFLRTLEDHVNWAPTDTTNLYSVQGTVTTIVNMTSAGNAEFYIQDGTGGIAVFVAGGTSVPDSGSVVQVTGPLGQFDGLLELNLNANNPDHSVAVTGSGPLPAPQPFSFSSLSNIPQLEATESSLVVVSNVFLGSTNLYFAQSSSVTLTNLSGQTFTLFINANSSDIIGQPIPPFAASITGVLGQHKATAPYTSAYELDITQYSDLVAGTPPPPATLPIPLNIQVSGGSLTLTWSDASFSLQSSTNAAGPFSNIPAAAGLTTYTDTMTNGANFYRLMHP